MFPGESEFGCRRCWCAVRSGRSVGGIRFGCWVPGVRAEAGDEKRPHRQYPGIGDGRGLCERCRGGRQHDELQFGECVQSGPVHGLPFESISAEHGRCRAWPGAVKPGVRVSSCSSLSAASTRWVGRRSGR
ncbi:hypothetical protein FXW78_25235 [Rhodococcus opacus]|nr:hypothetical protein [Rhodococcus opacus]